MAIYEGMLKTQSVVSKPMAVMEKKVTAKNAASLSLVRYQATGYNDKLAINLKI